MPSRILRTDKDLASWIRYIEAQEMPLTVSAVKGAKRSEHQNKTIHLWFSQIAQATHQSAAEAKAECKLIFGLPIMQAERQDWVHEWAPLYEPLRHDHRLKLFQCIPMTRLMSVKQLSAFMEAIQKEYRAQGIPLIDPEAQKYEADYGYLEFVKSQLATLEKNNV